MIQLGEHLVLKDVIGWLKTVETASTILSLEHLWTGDQADREEPKLRHVFILVSIDLTVVTVIQFRAHRPIVTE